MRRAIGLAVGPLVGAVSAIVWGEIASWAGSSSLEPAALGAALQDGIPITYVLAACASWPTVGILRRTGDGHWVRWGVGALVAGAFFGVLLLWGTLLVFEGVSQVVQPDSTETLAAALFGCAVTLPSVTLYWLLVESHEFKPQAG